MREALEEMQDTLNEAEDFKPHKMYDPKTGKSYDAKTMGDHLKMKKKGYDHEKPKDEDEDENDIDESLWANIAAKRKRIKAGSGEKMRKKGDAGAPTPDQMAKAKNEEYDLDEGTKQILAHGGRGKYKVTKDGDTIEIKFGGKVVGTADFDRGADSFFVSIKGEKGQKSFDDAQAIADYFAKNKITEEVELDEQEMSPVVNQVVKAQNKLEKAKKLVGLQKQMSKVKEEEVDLELDEGKMSQLHQYIKDKKSPEEIAKIMKVDVATIKKLMSEEVDLDEAKMSSSQIAKLKKAYEPMRDKKIGMENANRLSAMMNKVAGDKEALMQLFKADIPFVSQSAVTKLITKHGMKGAEINKLREGHEINEVFPFAAAIPAIAGTVARIAVPAIARKVIPALGRGALKTAGALGRGAVRAATGVAKTTAGIAAAGEIKSQLSGDQETQERDAAREMERKQREQEFQRQDVASRKAESYVDEGLVDNMLLSLFGRGKKPEGKLIGSSKAASNIFQKAKKARADRAAAAAAAKEGASSIKEASAYSDARRAMAADPSTKQRFSKNISASDDDIKSADKNIIMQLRNVVSLKGAGTMMVAPQQKSRLKKDSGYLKSAGSRFIEFENGKREQIDLKVAQALLDKYNQQRKPSDKEKFQSKISKSKRDMLKALKETNQIDKNRTSLSKVKNFMKENGEK